MDWGIIPLKNTTPSFFAKPSLKSGNSPSPLFRLSPLLIVSFFCELPPPPFPQSKLDFSVKSHNILSYEREKCFYLQTKAFTAPHLYKFKSYRALTFGKYGRRFNPPQHKRERGVHIIVLSSI